MSRALSSTFLGVVLATALPLTLVGPAPRLVAAAGLGTIEGSVVDASGAVKSAGVRVTIKCGSVTRQAPINGAGQFRVDGLPEGSCIVTASGTGFQTVSYRVNLGANSIATVLVRMAPPAPPAAPVTAVEPAPMAEAPADRPKRAERVMAKPAKRLPMGGGMAANGPVANKLPPMQAVKLDDARDLAKDKAANLRRRPANEDAKEKLVDGDAWMGDEEMGGEAVAYAPVRVFPVPQYVKGYDGPRNDFRETIYWNPSVETDENGYAEVSFVTSDAVTAFKATAEGYAGSTIGGGSTSIKSKLPLTLDAHLPIEVTAGDTIRLPITITNETSDALDADLVAHFGPAFKVTGNPTGKLKLGAKEKKSIFVPLEVIAPAGDAGVKVALTSRGLKDEIEKTIRVVPRGFPFTASASGTVKGMPGQPGVGRHELDLAGALPGSVKATVTMYPSPLASMTKGMEAMIQEPGGCFEQTSSTNYPNIMILGYLQSNDAADAALVGKTQGVLDRGYKLLTGYETKQKGYEWFGNTPGHEALTAYGLMEFADMAKVYDVDNAMVQRTADWLMSRRDGKGGFQRSSQALDSFGRASEATTNAYIMWALAEAKRVKGLDVELAAQKKLGASTSDPYLLALATNTALLAAPDAPETAAMVKKLVAMQGKDGAFAGAKESITMSGGESLTIEATSLATLAMLKSKNLDGQVRAAVDYLNNKRSGYGQWGNTQATVLGLKALTAYAEASKQMQASGTATLVVNGQTAGTIAFEKGRKDALVWDDIANHIRPGKNVVEVKLDGEAALPYTIAVEYRTNRPQSSPNAKVGVTTELVKTQSRMGEGVTLRAQVENKTAGGVPMTLARVGLPGGMVFQTWQLKELRDKGLVDFYETRPREVILYWRALAPNAKKSVDIQLLSKVPGNYEAPASSAYLYYTAEDKAWSNPTKIAIDK